MDNQDNQPLNSVQIEQKLWQYELEQIAQENDFLLNILVSVQEQHQLCTKHEEKITIFFNYFQYFFQLIRHLKESLVEIDKEIINKPEYNSNSNSNLTNFKEEMNSLEKKYQVFKVNFRDFILNINNHKRIQETNIHY